MDPELRVDFLVGNEVSGEQRDKVGQHKGKQVFRFDWKSQFYMRGWGVGR